jgi:hypothetical protein
MRGVCRLRPVDEVKLGNALEERQTRREESLGGLTVAQSVRRWNPAQPVQRANGKAGSRNQ